VGLIRELKRLVPPQTPDKVTPLVIGYIEAEFAKLNSKNKLTVELVHGGEPWVDNPDHWNYIAAIKATEVILQHYTFSFFFFLISHVIYIGRVS
jgi:hypothetical protein